MEPNVVYSFISALMDTELIFKMGLDDLDVSVISETVSGQITSLLFLVVFIIRC